MAIKRTAKPPVRGTVARPPSEQLAAIIRARGLSAYELARLAGVDHCGIGRFLRGERDLKLATVDRIAAALGLDLVERSRSRRPAGPVPRGESVFEVVARGEGADDDATD